MELSELERYCESPIEQQLARAIADVFEGGREVVGMVLTPLPPMDFTRYVTRLKVTAAIIPQAVISEEDAWNYRVDFLLVCGPHPLTNRVFAIECDGHEWHEKTKEQVARDKLRDRRLLMAGIIPVRFSGSEIYADAADCAEYLRSLAHDATGDALFEDHSLGRS